MSTSPTIGFAAFSAPVKGTLVVLSAQEVGVSDEARRHDPSGILDRALEIAAHKGKQGASTEIIAPNGTELDRIIVLGIGKADALDEQAWLKTGGALQGALGKAAEATVCLDVSGAKADAAAAAQLASGILLRAYTFDRYKSRKDDDENGSDKAAAITIQCADPKAADKLFKDARGVVDGINLARDLVNEPANMLGPIEFAAKAGELEKLGVEVEVLEEADLEKLEMRALLGVAQGSARPPRLVVMRWNGGRKNDKPVAFVGKGVVFDSGGISIKPAAGMEDMKGDMGGAAAVTGLMHALAARKAKANVVGIIGLVENMVDGNAQRPGDIVKSMSGQTIEVLNTDAEGRLVLADALWYCNDRFEPRFMVDLATLTGAVLIALGQHHAGLFSNNDELAGRLFAAGQVTGEKVWRMPMGAEYDKMLDSKNADMKNIGGRHAGSITAAQFLQRFVKETPWAHLDVAGTAMASASNEINQSWASGFGVRLLDRLVREHYEG